MVEIDQLFIAFFEVKELKELKGVKELRSYEVKGVKTIEISANEQPFKIIRLNSLTPLTS